MMRPVTRRVWAKEVAAGLAGIAGLGSQVFATEVTRDAAYWPFAANDPWNMPIGSAAAYKAINSPGFSTGGGAYMNVTN